jgi:hypothetical protein
MLNNTPHLEQKNQSLHRQLKEIEDKNEKLKNEITIWFFSRYDKSNERDKSLYSFVTVQDNSFFTFKELYGC